MNFNGLLSKQIRKYLPEHLQNDACIDKFLETVNDSYNAFEKEKELSGRAFQLCEEEYIAANNSLRHELAIKKKSIQKLKDAIVITGDVLAEEETDDLLLISELLNTEVVNRRKAELIYTSLIANLNNAILLENEAGVIVYANQQFCNLFGLTILPEGLIGRCSITVAEESKHLFKNPRQFIAGIHAHLKIRALVTAEVIELANGRFVERDYIPIVQHNQYKGSLWSFTDITCKHLAHEALVKSEHTNRQIMNAALDAIVIVDKKTSVVFWNPMAEKMFGWPEREVLGKNLFELIAVSRYSGGNKEVAGIFKGENALRMLNRTIEATVVNRAQREFPVEFTVAPVNIQDDSFFCGYIRDVTERKNAEKQLKESQQRWQFALQGAGDGVWEYDCETGTNFYSRQFKKILGYTDAEFGNIGDNWMAKIHPFDHAAVQSIRQSYIKEAATAHKIEYRVMHKNGSYIWILDRGALVSRNKAGRPKRVISTVANITSVKRTEQALLSREEELRTLTENIPGVLYKYEYGPGNKEGFTYISPGAESKIGITSLQLKEFYGILHPDDKVRERETSREARKMRTPYYFEGRFIPKGEQAVWLRFNSTFASQKMDGALVYTGIIVNITKEKEAELALHLREEKYRNIIANMNLGLVEVDNDEMIQFVNQGFCNMSGFAPEELIGKKASQLLLKKEVSPAMEAKNRLRKKGISDAYEMEVKNKNNEDRWWLISGAPRYNDAGVLTGSIGIHLDITEQKNTEMALVKARELAEASVKAKQVFLATVSHEIRTPLNAIIGITGQLAKSKLDKEQHASLNIVGSAAEHLLVVVNDILDLSKIEAGKLVLEETDFGPVEVINNALGIMVPKAVSKGLQLLSIFSEPEPAKILVGDPHRLSQVIFNLLSNAIKFTEKGDIVVTCSVVADDADQQVLQFMVADTGIGMDEVFLKNIFKRYAQEDASVARKFGGTGLGMSISKDIVEMMAGNISVQSTKGKGTQITFNIPFKKGNTIQMPSKNNKTENTSLLKAKKILIVDDSEINRLVAATILKSYGVVVKEAPDAGVAIEMLANDAFDVVLMDMFMPGMDGIEATRFIRQQLKQTMPVIALTAFVFNNDDTTLEEAGINDYVAKPFKEAALLQAVIKWLPA